MAAVSSTSLSTMMKKATFCLRDESSTISARSYATHDEFELSLDALEKALDRYRHTVQSLRNDKTDLVRRHMMDVSEATDFVQDLGAHYSQLSKRNRRHLVAEVQSLTATLDGLTNANAA
jgi:hypothetical protein